MNAEIQFVDLDRSESLENHVQEKLNKLGTKYEWVVYAHVFFKKEPHDGLKECVCEIRLSAPGPRIFAQDNQENFEKAVAEVIGKLEVQLSKRKDEMHQH